MQPEIKRIAVAHGDTRLPRARPPGDFTPVRRWTLGSFDQLAGLRADLALLLHPEGGRGSAQAQICENLVLAASELVTNALRHGRSSTDVTLLVDQTWLLDVADASQDTPPVFAGRRGPGAGGMGLHLIRRLALDVGWYTTRAHKHVWVTFPVSAAGPPAPRA